MSYLRDCLRQILLLSLVIGLALGSFALPARATAVYEIPAVSAGVPTWIVDKAEILSLATKGQVKGTLEQLAKQTGKEVRFVTIHRLDYGDTIQVFTDKVFKKWFPTPEDQANQTLIVLDNVTNTIGIQTGTEVKGLLTEVPHEKETPGFPWKRLFILPELNKKYEELTEEEHMQYNHRKIALDKLISVILNHGI